MQTPAPYEESTLPNAGAGYRWQSNRCQSTERGERGPVTVRGPTLVQGLAKTVFRMWVMTAANGSLTLRTQGAKCSGRAAD